MAEATRPVSFDDDSTYPAASYAWYVVTLLMIAYVFSFIDRQIMNLLVKPVQADLGISDLAMSLLMGPSFALFYTILGFPFGYLADRMSRRTLIAWGVAFWSLMTACCGVADSYEWLFIFRMGVGIGEAVLGPAAYSLITDYFPRRKLAAALSVYSMGIYLGSGLAFTVGGLVAGFAESRSNWTLPVVGPIRSWQLVFFIVGLPGLLIAMAILATLTEPVRRGAGAKKGDVSLKDTLRYIWANGVTFYCHSFGIGLVALSSYAASSWIPTLLVRKHGLSIPQAGVMYGLVVMFSGTLGVNTGGSLAGWLAKRGYRDANMRVPFLAALFAIPIGILYPFITSVPLLLVAVGVVAFLAGAPWGAGPAAIQQIMPNAMRGQASALYLFIVNVLGLGIGPLAPAFLTETVFGDRKMLDRSLAITHGIALVLGALTLAVGLPFFRRSRAYFDQWSSERAASA